jgi:hypothetical protein
LAFYSTIPSGGHQENMLKTMPCKVKLELHCVGDINWEIQDVSRRKNYNRVFDLRNLHDWVEKERDYKCCKYV